MSDLDKRMDDEFTGDRKITANAVEFWSGSTTILLRSYNTIVADITLIDGKYVPTVYSKYSVTTLKHIKRFLRRHGFKAVSIDQIMSDYGIDK